MTSETGDGRRGATLLEMTMTLAIVALFLLVSWPRWTALRFPTIEPPPEDR